MTQKYIAVFLVLMLPGLATPAFAGDYMNTKLLPESFHLTLAVSPAHAPGTTFSQMAGTLAFAPPQSSQDPAQPPQPAQPAKPTQPNSGQTTSGVFKWGGIAVMIGGGALVARGATLSDPCSGFSGPGVLCTSNYQTVRTSSFALGGAAIVVGALLFSHRHHH